MDGIPSERLSASLPPSAYKIMNSHKEVGDPLVNTFHLSLLRDRERQSGVARKDEVQTGSNIVETEIGALGPRCPALVSIMDEVRRKWPHLQQMKKENVSLFWPARSSPALIHLWIEQESIILEITFKAFHFDLVPVDLPGTIRTD